MCFILSSDFEFDKVDNICKVVLVFVKFSYMISEETERIRKIFLNLVLL